MRGPELLRAWRSRKGVSQAWVAEHLGRSQAYISMLETSQSGIGTDVAFDLEELSGGEVPASSWRTPRDTEAA